MTTPAPRAPDASAWLIICRDGKTPGCAYLSRESAEEHVGPGERIEPLYDTQALASARRDAREEDARDFGPLHQAHVALVNADSILSLLFYRHRSLLPNEEIATEVAVASANAREAAKVIATLRATLGGAAARCPSCGQEKGCAAVCADSTPHEGSTWSMCPDPFHDGGAAAGAP